VALVLADRVKETTTTTGTGTYTLAGAVTGFESFASIGNGNTTYYCCTDGTDFEIGVGTYTSSGTTLARTTILQSSNSDNAVSWSSGTRDIFCTQPAEKTSFVDNYTANATLAAFVTALANTSGGAFTLTLPASPRANDEIIILDAAGTFDTNNLTVARNGNTIQGASSDLVCDVENVAIRLHYTGSDWRVFAIVGVASSPISAFKNIAVSGQSNVVADSSADTLTLVAGSNMTITTDASADSVTFAASGGGSVVTPGTAYFDAYLNSNVTVGSGSATVAFDAIRQNVGSAFSLSSGEITISEAGTYCVMYQVTLGQTGTSSRTEGQTDLQKKAAGGSFANVDGTDARYYIRNSNQDETTGSASAILTISANDVLQVLAARVSGSGSVIARAGRGRITIFRIA
tara:strand:+ start:6621 stop:7829 length:1209 start_codon:yes stop_codon:yes gene_type:complete